MRGQSSIIIGIIVVILVAVFSVINVDPVEVNYLLGKTEWPLVLVILFSVLMGGLLVAIVGMYKIYQLKQEIRGLRKKIPASAVQEQVRKSDKVQEEKSKTDKEKPQDNREK